MSASKTAAVSLDSVVAKPEVLQLRRKLRGEKRRIALYQIALLAIAVLSWELLVVFGVLQELFVGQPSKIVDFLVSMTRDGSLAHHTSVTVIETVGGFVGGSILGSAMGLLLWWSKTVERVLDPMLVALNSLPKIALTPILLIWFGVGLTMKLALSFSTVFLVTFLAATASLAAIDNELVHLAGALGATRWQIFVKIVFPSSVPWMLSTMKICIGFALTGAVIGEFVASNEGLGYLLMYAAQLYEMSMVWAGVFALLVIAMLMYYGIVLIERSLLRWRE